MNTLKIPLRALQVDMQRHLLGEASTVTAAIVDAPPLPAADRLAIYRNAYQVRLIDALHETYPVLHGLLGDEAWGEMGQAYVAAHPSVFRSIRWYGRELADFLAASTPIARRRFSPRSRCSNGPWRRYSMPPTPYPCRAARYPRLSPPHGARSGSSFILRCAVWLSPGTRPPFGRR